MSYESANYFKEGCKIAKKILFKKNLKMPIHSQVSPKSEMINSLNHRFLSVRFQ